MHTQTVKIRKPNLDAAIRHCESVHQVIVLRRKGAKVIPFPPRKPAVQVRSR